MTEKQIIKLMKFPLTDQGNAERLRFIFGNKWKYLPRYKLWLHWNGHRWEGRRTVNLIWTAGEMFHELILAICRLPAKALGSCFSRGLSRSTLRQKSQ